VEKGEYRKVKENMKRKREQGKRELEGIERG
jgi:hypothetical protein